MAYRDYDRDREFRERGYSGKEDDPERGPSRSADDDRKRDRDDAPRPPDDTDLGFRRPDFSEEDFGTDRVREPDTPE